MIQSFGNEFDLLDESPQLPAPPGEVVRESLDEEKGSKYRSGTGKIMMKCSCYEIMIRARELSRFMAFLTPIHLKHMHRPMIYVRHTAKFGNFIKPKVIWDSHDKAMEFIISGRNALDPETRRSSRTEAEFVAAVEVVQNLLSPESGRINGIEGQAPDGNRRRGGPGKELNCYRASQPGLIFCRSSKKSSDFGGVDAIAHMSTDIFTKNVGGADSYKHRDIYVREDPCAETPTTTYPVGGDVGVRFPDMENLRDAGEYSSNKEDSVVEPYAEQMHGTGSLVFESVNVVVDDDNGAEDEIA